jgi:hypothetical protein
MDFKRIGPSALVEEPPRALGGISDVIPKTGSLSNLPAALRVLDMVGLFLAKR